MKTCLVLFLGIAVAAGLVVAETVTNPPDIEVSVRFIDVCQDSPDAPPVEWLLSEPGSKSSQLTAREMSGTLVNWAQRGDVDILAAPRVTTRSGSNAVIKVVTECRYPTDLEISPVSFTNGSEVVSGIAFAPGGFETRDVGITLNVTPVFEARRNIIEMKLDAEVVVETVWTNYPVTYKDADGTTQTVAFPQPFFHTRRVSQNLSLFNGSTVMMGGMVSELKKRTEHRVPVLGSIPWLGRLFRTYREVPNRRNLFIFVTARTVDSAK